MKTVAIIQSNYVPWKGYFNLVGSVDQFIFHDDLQYTKNDWRNRNKIMTKNGPIWLTIPCGINEKRLINQVRVDNVSWQKKHFESLRQNYRRAPYWNYCLPFLEEVYLSSRWEYLSDLNQFVIKSISRKFLNFDTEFSRSESFGLKKNKEDRVLELLKAVNASEYVSGPSGQNYLTPTKFVDEGIKLRFFSYRNYPEYQQLSSPFMHSVSILDLLLCTGPMARDYLL